MFADCSSLTSIDLSNFNIAKIYNMNNLFNGCTKLQYINLKHFVDPSSTNIYNMFDGIPRKCSYMYKFRKRSKNI